jgi:hypothetical protein
MDERICPVHGASFFNVEWDGALGRAVVSQLSPKAVIPQDGVTGSVEEMEYYFLRIPQTRGYIRRNWGVELEAAYRINAHLSAQINYSWLHMENPVVGTPQH